MTHVQADDSIWAQLIGCPYAKAFQPVSRRRRKANEVAEGDHYHGLANPAKGEPPGEGAGARPVKPTG